MRTHNICFNQEIKKLFSWYQFLFRPMNHVTFVLFCFFFISPFFNASGRLSFMTVAFPGYLHLYLICCPIFCAELETILFKTA